jgi:dolichol-phosphate mannosyltransferase
LIQLKIVNFEAMSFPQVTVCVPAFNEAQNVDSVLSRILERCPDSWQIIVVDDGSTDGTDKKIQNYSSDQIEAVCRPKNGGKTAAIRDGLERAKGTWFVIQDADLEYDPADIQRLLSVAQQNDGVVYGQRPSYWHKPSRWTFAAGVLLVDLCFLLVYRRWVRDHATCYKLMPTELIRQLELQSSGFEGCVEITAKLMKRGIAIDRVPISYQPRSAKEGKKLTWRYGFTALKSVWRWRNWSSARSFPKTNSTNS